MGVPAYSPAYPAREQPFTGNQHLPPVPAPRYDIPCNMEHAIIQIHVYLLGIELLFGDTAPKNICIKQATGMKERFI